MYEAIWRTVGQLLYIIKRGRMGLRVSLKEQQPEKEKKESSRAEF